MEILYNNDLSSSFVDSVQSIAEFSAGGTTNIEKMNASKNDRTSPKTWSEFFSTKFQSNALNISSTFSSDQFAHDVSTEDCAEK